MTAETFNLADRLGLTDAQAAALAGSYFGMPSTTTSPAAARRGDGGRASNTRTA